MNPPTERYDAPFRISEVLAAGVPWALVWPVLVGVISAFGQPGVACVTPLAVFALAITAGGRYARRVLARPDQKPGIAPLAAVGAIVGVGLAVAWLIGGLRMDPTMPITDPFLIIGAAGMFLMSTLVTIVMGKITR